MYQAHPCFEPPQDENARIWRYMDFSKYVELLFKSSLFFVRSDKLGDPFEGSFTKANVRLRPEVYAKTGVPTEALKALGDFVKGIRLLAAINFWHLSEGESAAMWALYARNNQGIAIQSTFKRLVDALKNESRDIHIGKVQYIDYDKDWLPESNLLYPFVHKRNSFAHERELRALVIHFPSPDAGSPLIPPTPIWDDGTYVPVDLNQLVETAYLSPTTQDWVFDVVKSVTGKYGFTWEIKRSNLDDAPMY